MESFIFKYFQFVNVFKVNIAPHVQLLWTKAIIAGALMLSPIFIWRVTNPSMQIKTSFFSMPTDSNLG